MDAGGPAFSAYPIATQSLPTNTFTKLVFGAEEFDTANCFDSTTNYRFTPNVAGYYLITANALMAGAASSIISIYKNGVEYKRGSQGAVSSSPLEIGVSAIVYLNGSTDYVELFGFQGSGTTATILANNYAYSYFQGILLKAA